MMIARSTRCLGLALLFLGIGSDAARAVDFYEQTILSHGPTQYYRLGEASGTTAVNTANIGVNNGTYTGTAATGYLLGQPGAIAAVNSTDTAVRFFGGTTAATQGYVNIGNLGARPAQGTIEFWMRPNTIADHRNVFTTSGTPGFPVGNSGFRFEEHSNSYVNPAFGGLSGNNAGTSVTGFTYGPAGVQNLTAGQWYHVALTWNDAGAGNLTGYMNGTQYFSIPNTNWVTTLNAVEIARGFSTSATASDNRWWDGWIDEVALYNRALTSTELLLHYNVGLGLATAPQLVPEPCSLALFGVLLTAVSGFYLRRRRQS